MIITNVFTFGPAHWPNQHRYVVIKGRSRADCRLQMVRRFGTAWAFQYDDLASAGVERYGLTPVPEPTVYTPRVNDERDKDSVTVDPWNSRAA